MLVNAFGFCQEISGSQLKSAPPSLWVLRGDGKVLTQPSPPPLREEIIIDLPGLSVDAVPLTLVRIPSGSFVMGRHVYNNEVNPYYELPLHTVTFSQDFLLGKYEITKAQWQAVMGTAPWEGHSSVSSASDSPAVWISWNDVQTFIAALNELGQGTFRLPREEEW
jgi:formylglycine-generating enzyme required for sulfatase activity